jgi:SNF2 family DNA or RNA helicase
MTRAEISDDNSLIEVYTTYVDRELIKQVPGSAFRKDPAPLWTVPLGWPSCLALRGRFGAKLQLGPKLTSWALAQRSSWIDAAMILRDAITPDESVLTDYQKRALKAVDEIEGRHPDGLRLYPYQRVDVAWTVTARRGILGNDPGLGKTGALIRTLQVLHLLGEDPFPVLVVCPNSLKNTVWARELAAWAPELAVTVVHGGAATRRKQLAPGSDVYVINYEALRLHSRLAGYGNHALTEAEKTPKELNKLGLRTVICDEAHRVATIKSAASHTRADGTKATGAQGTRAAWALAQDARFRFAATGTPVRNNVGDLWPLLHLIDSRAWPTRGKWDALYVQSVFNGFGGIEVLGVRPEHEKELHATVDPVLRRAPKKLALPQLPQKLPVQYRETPMSPRQDKAYRQMAAYMAAQLDELVVAPNALAQLTRLLQFSAASAETDQDGRVRLTAPSGKVDDLVDMLGELGDAPLVVAAVSRQLIELAAHRLSEEGVTHGLITGAQSITERQRTVDLFQGGHIRVALLTLGAGAEGITLTRASNLLFMQKSWSTVQNKQAEDRIYRIGSERHDVIRIMHQVTPDSLEQRLIEVLEGKEEQVQQILRDRASLARLLGVEA